MKLVVMKFGGTSVGSIDKINNVANIVEKQLNDKKLIVVLSAMSGVTNKMQEYIDVIESNEIIENDLILTSGEAVSVGLLSAILKKRNIKSIPVTFAPNLASGSQIIPPPQPTSSIFKFLMSLFLI